MNYFVIKIFCHYTVRNICINNFDIYTVSERHCGKQWTRKPKWRLY